MPYLKMEAENILSRYWLSVVEKVSFHSLTEHLRKDFYFPRFEVG